MNRFECELYKEMYYHEIYQKEVINNRISIPVGIISLLVGVAYFYISSEKNVVLNFWGVTFFILLSLFIISLVLAVYFCARAYYNYEYAYIAMPEEIHKYSDGYDDYYEGEDNKENLVKNEVDLFLAEQYMKATHRNRKNNEIKIAYLRFASLTLLIALSLAALCIYPFHVSFSEAIPVIKVI